MVTFADSVCECAEDNAMTSVSEKGAVSEGHRNVLCLLYQLCPATAPESPLTRRRGRLWSSRRVCDFEGLFALVDRPSAARVHPPIHRVMELRADHLQHCAAAESGKLPSSALPSRRRNHCSCSDPSLAGQHLSTLGFLGLLVHCPTSAFCVFLLKKPRGWNPCVFLLKKPEGGILV